MAIKGCSRQMIVLNGTGSGMFETAYFIVKADADLHSRSQGDMMREANRIVEEYTFPVCRSGRGKSGGRGRWRFFLAGAAAGGAVIGFLWFLFAII